MNKLNVSNLPATNKRHPSAPNEIYVGNLSFFCSEDHLTELFSQYGGVKSCRIICGRSRKRSLSFGFVEMPTLQHANEAVAALDGHLFMGRNLRVELSDQSPNDVNYFSHTTSSQASSSQSGDSNLPGFQVHVTFTSSFNSPKNFILPTEAFIRKVFCQFGNILDICVKEYSINPGTVAHQQGYGFITFAEEASAYMALHHAEGLVSDGIRFACTQSHKCGLSGMNKHSTSFEQNGQRLPKFSSIGSTASFAPSMESKADLPYVSSSPQQYILSKPCATVQSFSTPEMMNILSSHSHLEVSEYSRLTLNGEHRRQFPESAQQSPPFHFENVPSVPHDSKELQQHAFSSLNKYRDHTSLPPSMRVPTLHLPSMSQVNPTMMQHGSHPSWSNQPVQHSVPPEYFSPHVQSPIVGQVHPQQPSTLPITRRQRILMAQHQHFDMKRQSNRLSSTQSITTFPPVLIHGSYNGPSYSSELQGTNNSM